MATRWIQAEPHPTRSVWVAIRLNTASCPDVSCLERCLQTKCFKRSMCSLLTTPSLDSSARRRIAWAGQAPSSSNQALMQRWFPAQLDRPRLMRTKYFHRPLQVAARVFGASPLKSPPTDGIARPCEPRLGRSVVSTEAHL